MELQPGDEYEYEGKTYRVASIREDHPKHGRCAYLCDQVTGVGRTVAPLPQRWGDQTVPKEAAAMREP